MLLLLSVYELGGEDHVLVLLRSGDLLQFRDRKLENVSVSLLPNDWDVIVDCGAGNRFNVIVVQNDMKEQRLLSWGQ